MVVGLAAAGCGQSSPPDASLAASAQPATADAATRSTPVVPGRRSRVFIFAALGERCEPIAAPQVEITAAPSKGALTFVPGQQTTIATSLTGACNGRPATGTGVYYTAREGAAGSDRFAVTAHMGKGQAMSRTFEVRIEP